MKAKKIFNKSLFFLICSLTLILKTEKLYCATDNILEQQKDACINSLAKKYPNFLNVMGLKTTPKTTYSNRGMQGGLDKSARPNAVGCCAYRYQSAVIIKQIEATITDGGEFACKAKAYDQSTGANAWGALWCNGLKNNCELTWTSNIEREL